MAFIVFEGGDGSGKSTQCRALVRRFRSRNLPVLLTREPGGTPLGESLRRLLKRRQDISPISELLLFEAARAQLVNNVIRPALEAGTTVICDRFISSTLAYQGYGRGIDLDLIDRLNQAATYGTCPDLTVWLDLPVEIGLARKGRSGGDTFDGAPDAFHQRVRQGYAELAAQEPEKWLVLDATLPPREISQTVWARVQPLL